MGETCIKSRVFGFAHEHTPVVQGPREQRNTEMSPRPSLLSQLLKDPSYRQPYEDLSESDTDMEEDTEQPTDSDSEDEEERPGGTAPMKIPNTSEGFLRAQREALQRFMYLHQLQEMKLQCQAYFERQTRMAAITNGAATCNHNVQATGAKSTGVAEQGQPSQHLAPQT